MRARWWLPLVLLLACAPLYLHWWEPALFLAINQACAPLPAPLWTALSLGGNAWGVLALSSPLLVLAPRLLWAWLAAAPFAVLFARLGKTYFESARPAGVLDRSLMRIVGEPLEIASMPSGHTLTAFAVAGSIFLALQAPQRARWWGLWLAAALVGLSRMALGAHWPGDVAVGACLGLWAAALGQLLWRRMGAAFVDPRGWRMRALALLLLATLYTLLEGPLDYPDNQTPQYLLAAVVLLVLLRFAQQQKIKIPGEE